MKLFFRSFLAVLLCFFTSSFACASVPHVVVSMKPIYSWVSAVMEGVGEPELLIKGGESVHGYALKPSDATSLSKADIVFMVSKNVEVFLQKPLQTLAEKAQAVSLIESPGVELLPTREGKYFESHGGHHHGAYNPHIWLDPQNAIYATKYIASILSQKDPEHAARYQENAKKYCATLEDLIAKTKQVLAPYQQGRFIVFHDAYYYYEKRFGVQAVGAITVDPEHEPGAKRLKDIHDKIAELKAVCVFSEPQFTPKLLSILVEGVPGVKTGALDPLGAGLKPGKESYITLINNITHALTGCFGATNQKTMAH